jgi:hypothetical protein
MPAAYVILLGTLLTWLASWLAWYYEDQSVENRGRARFDETVIIIEEALDQRMDAYVDAKLDSRGLLLRLFRWARRVARLRGW